MSIDFPPCEGKDGGISSIVPVSHIRKTRSASTATSQAATLIPATKARHPLFGEGNRRLQIRAHREPLQIIELFPLLALYKSN
ncbi:MAG: hypothetical protein PHE55_11945 [Methylococcaceae bacterium]|nr:hypothetical protein [Methylococcaceae bacterium]